jgi:hypothetical protein
MDFGLDGRTSRSLKRYATRAPNQELEIRAFNPRAFVEVKS